jgi:hypothetical protein
MIDGLWVPVIGVGALVGVWIVILYGSQYFGPR